MAEEAVTVGRKGLLAPEHDELGKLEHRVVIASGQATGVVHLGVGCAHDVGRTRNARDVAGITGLRVASVGGAQACVCIGGKHGATLTTGTAHNQDGLGTILVLEVLHLLGDGVICLVPGDALPLVLAAVLAGALHGIQDAIRIVDVVADGQAADTEAAVGDGVVLIALDAHELTIGVHVGLDAASGRMASRRRPRATAGDGEAVFFEAPWLAKIGSALTFENLHALSFPLLSQPALPLRTCDSIIDRRRLCQQKPACVYLGRLARGGRSTGSGRCAWCSGCTGSGRSAGGSGCARGSGSSRCGGVFGIAGDEIRVITLGLETCGPETHTRLSFQKRRDVLPRKNRCARKPSH